jgi:hypothetical protein
MAGKNTAFHRDRVEKNNGKKHHEIRFCCEQIVNRQRFLLGIFRGEGGGRNLKILK